MTELLNYLKTQSLDDHRETPLLVASIHSSPDFGDEEKETLRLVEGSLQMGNEERIVPFSWVHYQDSVFDLTNSKEYSFVEWFDAYRPTDCYVYKPAAVARLVEGGGDFWAFDGGWVRRLFVEPTPYNAICSFGV